MRYLAIFNRLIFTALFGVLSLVMATGLIDVVISLYKSIKGC